VVKFEDVIAYQIRDESFTYGDEYEKRTEGALCKYERSRYLDYVKSHSLIDALRENQYAHYGLMLEDEIIDVISETEPKVMDASSEEMQNEFKLRFANEGRI
jgi:hypothetical protein